MATVKFILRKDKKNERGLAPIYAQYIHKEAKGLIATHKKVEPKHWNKVQGKVKGIDASGINGSLDTIRGRIGKIANELDENDIEPTPFRVKDAYYKKQKDKLPEAELTRSIIFQWKDYLNSRRNTIKARTYSNQFNSIEALENWLNDEKTSQLRPEQFTFKHLTKWQNYLSKDHSPNTVAKRLKHLKAFLKYYQELGGQTGLNLVKIKYKETEGVKIYLTVEELKTFQNAEVKGRQEQIRDLFVLQCNTGLRISDLKRLDKNISGNRIVITTKKTGTNIEIPISPTIREILEKYSYQLPQIPEQKINLGIKDIYKICFPENKIQIRKGADFETFFKWELISSHDAIRTFITLSAEKGMTVSAISKITGKSIPVLLKHYLSQSQKVADQEMEKAWGVSPLKVAK